MYFNANPKYVCPQCGPDKYGDEIHALTHHTRPPMTLNEAIDSLSPPEDWQDWEEFSEYTDEEMLRIRL